MAAEPSPPPPLLDTHIHFYDPSRPGGVPWPPANNRLLYRTVMPVHLLEVAGGYGLTGCVAVECSGLVDDNAALLEIASASTTVRGVVGGGVEIGDPGFVGCVHVARGQQPPPPPAC